MKSLPLFLLPLVWWSVCLPGRLQAQVQPVPAVRTALLMGVWDYQDATFPPLPKKGIESDLAGMEAKLKGLGFEVTVVKNPTLSVAKKAVDTFGSALVARGGASLFYFTGHGSEHEGRNFLIPAGTNVGESADLDVEALAADRVLARMEKSGIKVNLVFLDCCRNALTKSGGETGLASMTAKGALIGFATRSGDVADASDDGSPYTKALLTYLDRPGVSLTDMHALVTQDLERSGSRRRPGIYADLSGIYHLVPADAAPLGGLTGTTKPTMPSVTHPPQKQSSPLDDGGLGKVFNLELPGRVLMRFCHCPAGEFTMGSPKTEKERGSDEDQAQVKISQDFWMGQMEVTQGQWEAVMGTNPSRFKGASLPVESIHWDDAQAFVAKLNQAVKLPAGWKFAVPTEAQWEYACRAGTTTVFCYGDSLTSREANFDGGYPYGSTAKGPNLEKTAAVASYAPNAWGLFDMHGNVWEWCQDVRDSHSKLPGGTDPVGAFGRLRAVRGGGWYHGGWVSRSALRGAVAPGDATDSYGLRCAIVQQGP